MGVPPTHTLARPLMLSGVLAVQAGLRNSRRESWLFGVIALVGLGAAGVICCGPANPYTAVALDGLVVYLSPSGRAVFRKGSAEAGPGTPP